MNHLTPQELVKHLQAGENWLMLDVRQPEEWRICNLSHRGRALLAPLNQLPAFQDKLPSDTPIAVYCHHGIRSQYAIQYLEQQGFTELYNLSGGIHAWAEAVEPEMKRY
jgi:rhodanese-related sulfurtransferase